MERLDLVARRAGCGGGLGPSVAFRFSSTTGFKRSPLTSSLSSLPTCALQPFFAQSLLDRSTISYHGESTATRCPRQGAFERRHKKKRDEGSWREPSSLFFLCRLSCFSQKCPALGSQMHRLHPDMLVFGAVWEVRQEAEGCIPKFLECYKPQAKEILLDYLHQASSMDHDQIDHLLRQNRDWWRLNCGEILQKKLPVSTCESSRTTLFSPLRTSSNGARCSTSASMLTP